MFDEFPWHLDGKLAVLVLFLGIMDCVEESQEFSLRLYP